MRMQKGKKNIKYKILFTLTELYALCILLSPINTMRYEVVFGRNKDLQPYAPG